MDWTAHYYHLLDAGVNYIPVRRDFTDLDKQMEYYLAHSQTSQRISDAARTTFRERYTSPAAEACYWRRLLQAWSSIAPRPKSTPSISFEEFMLHDNGKDYPYGGSTDRIPLKDGDKLLSPVSAEGVRFATAITNIEAMSRVDTKESIVVRT
ncbi:hypothetical protein KC336_g21044, partial [Hortaea werneckii]